MYASGQSRGQAPTFAGNEAFDSALHKTSSLIHGYLPSSPAKQDPVSLSQRIEQILSHFDRLDRAAVGGDDLREQNLEALRKLIAREAYFLDEEKKWLANRRGVRRSPQKDSFKASVVSRTIAPNGGSSNLNNQ